MSQDDARALARNADIYLSSVNGIAETREIINIDGSGNRVSEIMYGHEKVYLIIGENKIEPDYEKALYGARNIVAPLNAKRLNKNTPLYRHFPTCSTSVFTSNARNTRSTAPLAMGSSRITSSSILPSQHFCTGK